MHSYISNNQSSNTDVNLQLDIIIPVYNEAANIIKVFEQFRLHIKCNYRVLICYDFPEDDTLIAIRTYQEQMHDNYNQPSIDIQLIRNSSSGPLSAIVSGFKRSTAPYVLVYPADDFINAQLIDQMMLMAKNGAEIVCPSRFISGGYMQNCPKIKSLLMQATNFLLHKIAKIPTHDASNGFRLFSRKVLDTINIESTKGFAYSIELLVKAHRLNYKIVELPSRWIERTNGKSRFKIFSWSYCYGRWFVYAFCTIICKLNSNFLNTKKYVQ